MNFQEELQLTIIERWKHYDKWWKVMEENAGCEESTLFLTSLKGLVCEPHSLDEVLWEKVVRNSIHLTVCVFLYLPQS